MYFLLHNIVTDVKTSQLLYHDLEMTLKCGTNERKRFHEKLLYLYQILYGHILQ